MFDGVFGYIIVVFVLCGYEEDDDDGYFGQDDQGGGDCEYGGDYVLVF